MKFSDTVENLPGKKSQKGRLDTVRLDSGIKGVQRGDYPQHSIMRTVYENGELYCNDTLEMIRERPFSKDKIGFRQVWAKLLKTKGIVDFAFPFVFNNLALSTP